MPYGDGTGPSGMGPMTGRAAGYCAGYPVPGYMNPIPGRGWYGFGRGLPVYGIGYPSWGGYGFYPYARMPFRFGRGRGFGFSRGRGWFGFGRGRGGWFYGRRW
jgi:hypothetical protein